jgi:O-acetyl-ADP-ribose deacetylase (regulator of RNase III)
VALIEHTRQSIIEMDVDAIVNAANRSLLGGGGVDGVIHRAAGTGLLEECRTLNGCETGKAKVTAGHNLPARWIIHTVGPIWRGGSQGEAEALGACYKAVLECAGEIGARSVAIPAISTGAYGFPADAAARIAVESLAAATNDDRFERLILVSFDRKNSAAVSNALQRLEAAQ